MDAKELQEYIRNNDLTPKILESLNCKNIKEYSTEYRSGLPGDERSQNHICIKKDSLSIRVYTNQETLSGNIYTLIMNYKKISFVGALKYLHSLFNIPFSYKNKEKKKRDALAIFKKINAKYKDQDKELKIYDKDVLEPYYKIPYIDWVREGILPRTQEKYNIMFSDIHSRVLIPHYYWCGDENDIVGIIGRTTVEDWDELGMPKYYPIIRFPKTLNIYGLQQNYKTIQETGIVYVFEGEKSVLKMDSYGQGNAVAIGSHDISKEQIKILISLGVEICFCYDNDIDEKFIRQTCERFKKTRMVSYIYDRHFRLPEKSSPIDGGLKVFKELLKEKKYI